MSGIADLLYLSVNDLFTAYLHLFLETRAMKSIIFTISIIYSIRMPFWILQKMQQHGLPRFKTKPQNSWLPSRTVLRREYPEDYLDHPLLVGGWLEPQELEDCLDKVPESQPHLVQNKFYNTSFQNVEKRRKRRWIFCWLQILKGKGSLKCKMK